MGEQAGAGGGGTSDEDANWVGAGGLSADEAEALSGDFRAVWDDGADAGKSLRKQTLIGMAPASVTREPATSTRVSSITPPEAGPEASADSAPSVPAPGKSDGPPRPKATMLGLGAVKLPDPGASAPPAQGASSAETAPASVAKADATDSVPRGDEKKL